MEKTNKKYLVQNFKDGREQPIQYGHDKTITVWLYQKNPPTLAEFNKILNDISHEDTTGHLFIVDIKFNDINPKTLLFNEMYPPIFENNKKWTLMKDLPYNF